MEKEYLLKVLERLNISYWVVDETTVRILEDNYGETDIIIEFDEQGNVKEFLVVWFVKRKSTFSYKYLDVMRLKTKIKKIKKCWQGRDEVL